MQSKILMPVKRCAILYPLELRDTGITCSYKKTSGDKDVLLFQDSAEKEFALL